MKMEIYVIVVLLYFDNKIKNNVSYVELKYPKIKIFVKHVNYGKKEKNLKQNRDESNFAHIIHITPTSCRKRKILNKKLSVIATHDGIRNKKIRKKKPNKTMMKVILCELFTHKRKNP